MKKELEIIHVHIGELKVGDDRSHFKVILGSCVGICLFWPEKNRLAVAHCLLPEGHSEFPARFVNEAVTNLCLSLGATVSDMHELRAAIAGGSSMYPKSTNPALRVGEMNIAAAIKHLEAKKIKIIYQDVGLKYGRQFNINGQTGECSVRILEEVRL